MTRHILKLLVLVFYSFIVNGQTYKKDTIDYEFFGKTYVLEKITESNTNRTLQVKYDGPLLTYIHNGSQVGMDSKFRKNDTIMTVEWDLELSYNTANHHAAAKVTLNRHTNLLTMEKYKLSIEGIFSKKTIRKFKIIKLTKSQLILLDFTNLEKNRLYYFK